MVFFVSLLTYLITFVISFAIPIFLVLSRKSIGELEAASKLILWGCLMILVEHGGFGVIGVFSEENLSDHTTFHFTLVGIYFFLGIITIGILAESSLKKQDPIAWYIIAFVAIFGIIADLLMVIFIFPHGAPPPASIPQGVALYSYYFSWIAGIVISRKVIFEKKT